MARVTQVCKAFFDLTNHGLLASIAGSCSLVLSLYIAYKWDIIKSKLIRTETDRKMSQDMSQNKVENSKAEKDSSLAEEKINEVLNGRT